MRLNLGAGTDRLPGYVNVDIAAIPGVDVVHDLDVGPWPWPDGSVEEIRAFDVFEHVADPILFMCESWRVLEEYGFLDLHTSYWKTENSFTDPTHRRFCTERTFDYWCSGTEYQRRYGAAYGRGRVVLFDKVKVALDGQELAVVLQKMGSTPI